jgi:hypothetical protein
MEIAKTAPDALKLLWKNKFFLEFKDFKKIKEELSKMGYNFTDENLLMALKNLNFLTRNGSKGNYSYIQKHPYTEEGEIK